MLRRRIVTPDEQDAHSKWRHVLCCLSRPGVVRKTKRRTNKRERREGKSEILSQTE